MAIKMVSCPKCNATVSEDNLKKHMFRVHAVKTNTVQNSQTSVQTGDREQSVFLYTDDSGVVISESQYAEYHGDAKYKRQLSGNYFSKKEKVTSSTFAEINAGQKENTKYAVCPECKAVFLADQLQKHIGAFHSVHNLPPTNRFWHKRSYKGNIAKLTFFCPVCNAGLTTKDKLKTHIEKKHPHKSAPIKPEQTKSTTNPSTPHIPVNPAQSLIVKGKASAPVYCPDCRVELKNEARFLKHRLKVHGNKPIESGKSQKTIQIQPEQKVVGRRTGAGVSRRGDHIPESFIQSFDESRDGSKGLGHLAREWDGKFGSYPLHDNYDDESTSE